MENKLDSFTAIDGKCMFFQSWIPSENPKLVIALIHGLGEHSGRYDHWAGKFCAENMVFSAFDLRGHGLSEGKRGSINSLELIFKDIKLFLEKVESVFPGIPVVLYGHSLGGTLALNYILESSDSKVEAAIITSPWLKLSKPLPGYLKLLTAILGSVLPSYTQASGLAVKYLCNDKTVIEKYQSDPLVHDRISAGLFKSATRGGEIAIDKAGNISLPVLIMHGTDDRIVSAEGSSAFRNNAGQNVTLRLWEDLFHELHNEPVKDEIFNFIISWLGKNVN